LNPYQDWDPWAGGFDPAQQGMNVSFDLTEQAYRTLRSQGLSEEQAAAVLQHRNTRQSRTGLSLWDPTRLQQRPAYSGPAPWNFKVGNGLTAEEAIQAKATERRQVQKRNAELNVRRMGEATALETGPGFLGAGAMAGVTPQLPPALAAGRPIGVDDGLGFDPLALATAGANPLKIDSTLSSPSSQPMQRGSGGASLDPLQASLAAVDMASSVLPLTGGQSTVPPAPSLVPQPVAASDAIEEAVGRRVLPPNPGSINLDAGPTSQYGRVDAGPDISLTETPNVSGGGPGTSTAKGEATVARQAAKRGGLGLVDDALGAPDLGIGGMAQRGLQRAGAAARSGGMKNLGNALYRAGGAARVLAPAAAFGGAVLPAVFGAMDGYGQAGTGGALIQGGTGAAGALAGGAIGTAILPGVGTVIGAGIGSMLGSGAGSGLTGLAQGAVEKAQMGDTGFMGGIGRALDPLIETDFEKEQKAVLQQMNSPAMQAIRQQERTRQEIARADQAEALLMQAYLR